MLLCCSYKENERESWTLGVCGKRLDFDGVVDLSMVCVGCFDIMLSERGYCVVENQIWKFYVEDVVSVGFRLNKSPFECLNCNYDQSPFECIKHLLIPNAMITYCLNAITTECPVQTRVPPDLNETTKSWKIWFFSRR